MDNNTEISIECPDCGKNIDIELKDIQNLLNTSLPPKKEKCLFLFVFIALIGLILSVGVFFIIRKNNELNKKNKESDIAIEKAKKDIEKSKQEIIKQIKVAQEKSKQIIEEAQKKAYDIEKDALEYENHVELLKNKELNNLYPSLIKYGSGRMNVRRSYIESFKVSDNRVLFQFVNKSNSYAKPDFDIYFFNDFGFVIGEVGVHWLLDSIGPGEERVDEATLFGKGKNIEFNPTYFAIEFK